MTRRRGAVGGGIGALLGVLVCAAAAESPLPALRQPGPLSRKGAAGAAAAERILFINSLYSIRWERDMLMIASRAVAGESKGEQKNADVVVFMRMWFFAMEKDEVVEQDARAVHVETARPPRAAQTDPRIRIRLDLEKKARFEADLTCASNAVAMALEFRPPASGVPYAWRALILLPRMGVPEGESVPDPRQVEEICRGMSLELVGAGGERTVLHYGRPAGRAPCAATAWALRGIWKGWVIRGHADDRETKFDYVQLHGNRPVDGCALEYAQEQKPVRRAMTIRLDKAEAVTASP